MINNLVRYNTWWADDGGAHIAYVNALLEQGRLPSSSETYLAWHEPGYYLLVAYWSRIGLALGFGSSLLAWQEALNVAIFIVFLIGVWRLTMQLTAYRPLALINLCFFGFLFSAIKLAAFVNNELLAQTLLLWLVVLFCHWRLYEVRRFRQVLWWSILCALAMLVKLTAFILFCAAILYWLGLFIARRSNAYIVYVVMIIMVAGLFNAPWAFYKQRAFGSVFSINVFEQQKQDIVRSPGWKIIRAFNVSVFSDNPYWYTLPHSFASIVVSDTFGDYYNLFNNPNQVSGRPVSDIVLTKNGRFTSTSNYQRLLWVNRLGLFIFLLWLAGFLAFAIRALTRRSVELGFFVIAAFGGWAGLVYNVVRHPYVERGTLKIAFILYVLPIVSAAALAFWRGRVSRKVIVSAVSFVVVGFYIVLAWPIIVVD